jgi:glucokinase
MARISPVVGVDIGGTKIMAAVVLKNGKILGTGRRPTLADQPQEVSLEQLKSAINEALAAAGVRQEQLKGIGLGCPGPLDPETGVILTPPNLPNWQNMPLKAFVEQEFKVSACVDNDVNVGTLGEYLYGAAQGADPVFGMFVGTGIGGGLVIGGKLFRGFTKNAGEIGHTIIKWGGPKCTCGNKGCLEAIASRTAVVEKIERKVAKGKPTKLEIKGKRIRSKALAKAYAAGDKLVVKALDKSAKAVGIAAANVINLIGPEVVVIGGGVVEALGEAYVERVKRSAEKHSLPQCYEGVKVVASALGDDAGILGAAALARLELKV